MDGGTACRHGIETADAAGPVREADDSSGRNELAIFELLSRYGSDPSFMVRGNERLPMLR